MVRFDVELLTGLTTHRLQDLSRGIEQPVDFRWQLAYVVTASQCLEAKAIALLRIGGLLSKKARLIAKYIQLRVLQQGFIQY